MNGTKLRMNKRKDENYIPLGINAGGITRASVYKTLCPQHMLAPINSTEMTPNLQRAIAPENIDGTRFKCYSGNPVSWPSFKPLAQPVFEKPC